MSAHKLSISIKAIPATKNQKAGYEIRIGDFINHKVEKPKFSESLKQELTTLLHDFYHYAQSSDQPKGFEIETVQDGWVAHPIK